MDLDELCQSPLLAPKHQRRMRERIAKVGECWEWTRGRTSAGYGVFYPGKVWLVHRLTYTIAYGAIPTGLHIDHLCRNRACCRPGHLEAVTVRMNVVERGTGRSAQNAAKTHCMRGHLFDYITPDGRRQCKTCRSRRSSEWEARQKASRSGIIDTEG